MNFNATGLVVLILAFLAMWQASLATSTFGKGWKSVIPSALTGIVAGVAIGMNPPFSFTF